MYGESSASLLRDPTRFQRVFVLVIEIIPILFILVVISSLTVLFIVYTVFVKKPKSQISNCGLFLILAGAIGNLTDRVVYGHVLDFIDLRVWPVFNIADSSITIGAGLILWHLLITGKDKG